MKKTRARKSRATVPLSSNYFYFMQISREMYVNRAIAAEMLLINIKFLYALTACFKYI